MLSRVAWAGTTMQPASLPVIEAMGKLGDRVRPFAASRHSQSDEAQKAGQLVAHSPGFARFAHLRVKAFPERVQVGGGDWASRRQGALRIRQGGRQLWCSELFQSSGAQGANP